jgi:hypothetical protein
MKLLSEIQINGPVERSVIQLLQGDLTAIPEEHSADLLVVSAFPGDYTPLKGSLMYALHEKGLDVAELANDKAVNLVAELGCWLSQPLNRKQQEKFHFKQVLCFEPSQSSGSPEKVVSNIFRCINNFAFDDDNNVIIMPLLASGRQQVPVEKMLPAMLDASMFWLEMGIPIDTIKLVVYGEEQTSKALPIFNDTRERYEQAHAVKKSAKKQVAKEFAGQDMPRMDPPKPSPQVARNGGAGAAPAPAVAPPAKSAEYDYFISYSHAHTPEVAELVSALLAKNNQLNIFYDRSSIPSGGLWIKMISDAIQKSKCVVCILSPQYRTSDVCWDEFQCAKAKEYRTKKSVIKTINFMKDDEMPLIMSVYSYIDCTEGDIQKLKEAVNAICQG